MIITVLGEDCDPQERERIKQLNKISDVKKELLKVLDIDEIDKKTATFTVQSDKSKAIGGADELMDWTDAKERKFVASLSS